MPKPMKEAKRLAKSVKRRRLFAENLRLKAKEIRAASHTLEVVQGAIEQVFADRLDAMADQEFALAHEDEAKHKETSVSNAAVLSRASSPVNAEGQARGLAALAERGSTARLQHIVDTFSIAIDGHPTPGDLLKAVEDLLDREKMDQPKSRAGMKFGERINRAETLLFGQVRF